MTPLDNPVWAALNSRHANLARRAGNAARYPADVAPFVALADTGARSTEDALSLIAPGESFCFVGPAPRLPSQWHIDEAVPIAQMIRTSPLKIVEGPAVVELTQANVGDMLALTALVYPHYFRPRTIEMGRYVGIYDRARLAAMAGERLGCDGHQEISAVCTHPDYLGRGYARRLIALLTNDILAGGRQPFLHFSHRNTRAKALYERIGYAYRGDIALLAATRPAPSGA